MDSKKTLVLGASTNPERYSYRAVALLKSYNHPVIAVGIREGDIKGISIQKKMPEISDIHTITLYLGAKRQVEYYDSILSLNPKRIIFNPGAENYELLQKAKARGIEVVEDCTLVMLNSGSF